MSVLVLAEVDNGTLSPATARIVAAASQLGPVDLLVHGPRSSADAASSLAGVTKVMLGVDSLLANSLVASLSALAADYQYLVAAASTLGKDVMPRLAARLDIQPVTDIVAIEGPNRFVRPIYAGNALETVSDTQAKHVLTFRASAYRPVAGGNAAPVEVLETSVQSAARFIAAHRTESDIPDLATAQIVVCGGVSVGSAEGFQLIERLGKTLGAAVGATRAAVDAGYAPNDWQVGQTGKIVAPELYVAVAVSGAIQHLAGMKESRVIVAINKDPEAAIFQVADYGLVADLFDAVPELVRALGR
jgi:electron transfer flavoprotein alpha subunit